MKEARAQIEDILKQISDRKEARKVLSNTQKKLQDQIKMSRVKRANLSSEIKYLVDSINQVRNRIKEDKLEKISSLV